MTQPNEHSALRKLAPTPNTYEEEMDELLWKLQQHTLSAGYDPNHRTQQINRNTTKQALFELMAEVRIDELKEAAFHIHDWDDWVIGRVKALSNKQEASDE